MRRWYLPVIALNAVAATVTVATLAVGAPRLPKVWLVLDVLMFALACLVGCIVANATAPNGRSRALLASVFSWMLGGTMVGTGVGALYGGWARHTAMMGPAVIMLAVALIWRRWFRAAEAGTAEVQSEGPERTT